MSAGESIARQWREADGHDETEEISSVESKGGMNRAAWKQEMGRALARQDFKLVAQMGRVMPGVVPDAAALDAAVYGLFPDGTFDFIKKYPDIEKIPGFRLDEKRMQAVYRSFLEPSDPHGEFSDAAAIADVSGILYRVSKEEARALYGGAAANENLAIARANAKKVSETIGMPPDERVFFDMARSNRWNVAKDVAEVFSINLSDLADGIFVEMFPSEDAMIGGFLRKATISREAISVACGKLLEGDLSFAVSRLNLLGETQGQGKISAPNAAIDSAFKRLLAGYGDEKLSSVTSELVVSLMRLFGKGPSPETVAEAMGNLVDAPGNFLARTLRIFRETGTKPLGIGKADLLPICGRLAETANVTALKIFCEVFGGERITQILGRSRAVDLLLDLCNGRTHEFGPLAKTFGITITNEEVHDRLNRDLASDNARSFYAISRLTGIFVDEKDFPEAIRLIAEGAFVEETNTRYWLDRVPGLIDRYGRPAAELVRSLFRRCAEEKELDEMKGRMEKISSTFGGRPSAEDIGMALGRMFRGNASREKVRELASLTDDSPAAVDSAEANAWALRAMEKWERPEDFQALFDRLGIALDIRPDVVADRARTLFAEGKFAAARAVVVRAGMEGALSLGETARADVLESVRGRLLAAIGKPTSEMTNALRDALDARDAAGVDVGDEFLRELARRILREADRFYDNLPDVVRAYPDAYALLSREDLTACARRCLERGDIHALQEAEKLGATYAREDVFAAYERLTEKPWDGRLSPIALFISVRDKTGVPPNEDHLRLLSRSILTRPGSGQIPQTVEQAAKAFGKEFYAVCASAIPPEFVLDRLADGSSSVLDHLKIMLGLTVFPADRERISERYADLLAETTEAIAGGYVRRADETSIRRDVEGKFLRVEQYTGIPLSAFPALSDELFRKGNAHVWRKRVERGIRPSPSVIQERFAILLSRGLMNDCNQTLELFPGETIAQESLDRAAEVVAVNGDFERLMGLGDWLKAKGHSVALSRRAAVGAYDALAARAVPVELFSNYCDVLLDTFGAQPNEHQKLEFYRRAIAGFDLPTVRVTWDVLVSHFGPPDDEMVARLFLEELEP